MPITFTPAAPVAPGISFGAGQADEFNKLYPTQVAQQRNILSAFGDLLQQGNQGLHFQQQQMLQQQQAQNRITEMTVPEQLRLFKLQNALSAVGMDGSLSPEDKQRAVTILQSGIDPLQMKQQQWQAQQQQMQFQQMQQQQGMIAQIRNMDAASLKQMIEDHTYQSPDGSYSVFVNPVDGKLIPHDNQGQVARANAIQESARMRIEMQQSLMEHRNEMIRMREERIRDHEKHMAEMAQLRLQLQGQSIQNRQQQQDQALPRGVMNEPQYRAARGREETGYRNELRNASPPPEFNVGNSDQELNLWRQQTYERNINQRMRERQLYDNYLEYLQHNQLMRGHPMMERLFGPQGAGPAGLTPEQTDQQINQMATGM